jgi:hypothetical protein
MLAKASALGFVIGSAPVIDALSVSQGAAARRVATNAPPLARAASVDRKARVDGAVTFDVAA